jgi:glycosyltransferase involved in cell wall biosynthesis
MKLLMTHGYMFSGSGSNVYVQNLCRALTKSGHEVHLLCQEPDPLAYDFVDEHLTASGAGVELLGTQETPYRGRCSVYNPLIGDLLPVYVYDDYPGWRVKTFLDLTASELQDYLSRNVEAVRAVLERSGAEGAVTNHSLPGPEIARRALRGTGVPYASIVHGSCLQYVARRSGRYMDLAHEGLSGSSSIVALSEHSASTIAEDFPDLSDRAVALPGGVDTDLFRPDGFDPSLPGTLEGGPGRGPEAAAALGELLTGFPEGGTAQDLAGGLRSISSLYEPRRHDRDAGARVSRLLGARAPLIVYVGKLIHSKGVHCLLSAFAPVHRETGARLLVVGYGTFREGLEALLHAMSGGPGNRRVLDLLAENGRLFEGGPASPLEHFEVSEGLLRDARGTAGAVECVGPLYHAELARLLPAADMAVVPSIFPETFGLVAAEFAAAGVPPLVADHSGLREAGALVGRGLPFDPRVSLKGGFDENLARALTSYLKLPEGERRECRETVRRNAVEDLSWGALAERIPKLAGGSRC